MFPTRNSNTTHSDVSQLLHAVPCACSCQVKILKRPPLYYFAKFELKSAVLQVSNNTYINRQNRLFRCYWQASCCPSHFAIMTQPALFVTQTKNVSEKPTNQYAWRLQYVDAVQTFKMGQFFSCWICGSKTKVISLTRKENSTFAATDGPHILLSSSQIHFYQPSLRTGGDFKQFTKHTCISNCLDNNANSLKMESLSNCSSLATISLGSAQNLSVTSDEERDWRDGAINNRLQEQDVDYDHERQSSLPNIGKRLRTETNEIRRNPRAFSSMGRMALNFLKSKESKSNIGSRNNSQYSGSVAEIPTGRNCVVCTSWNERAEIELNTEIEKPQLIRTSPLYPGEISDSSSSETQTENNSVIKRKPKVNL